MILIHVDEPLLISNGEPNTEWRDWYANHCGVTPEVARRAQIGRIRKMSEPPLKTVNGSPNPDWSFWWRVQHNVSKNIADNIRAAKIKGVYIPAKRQQRDVDRFLRKVDKSEEKARLPVSSPRHQHKPFIMLAGEKMLLDGRLGNGELTLERLGKTKLGRQAIGKLVLLDKKYADAIKALVGEPTIQQ